MFDIFGIRAYFKAKKEAKEAEKLAIVQEQKRKYQERKKKINDYLEAYYEEEEKKCREKRKKAKKNADTLNSICPKCYSKNIIQTIVRQKGELHGTNYSSSSIDNSLFGFSTYSSSHGKIDGNLDTYPINKCKDCGHEWNVAVPEKVEENDIYRPYSSYIPEYLYYRIEEYLDMTYNPYDEKEEFNSLEDKQKSYCEKMSKSGLVEYYRTIPRYMVEYALHEAFVSSPYIIEDLRKIYNYHKDDDKYSYTMSDELWEIVKKILNWKGEETI